MNQLPSPRKLRLTSFWIQDPWVLNSLCPRGSPVTAGHEGEMHHNLSRCGIGIPNGPSLRHRQAFPSIKRHILPLSLCPV
ncbi:hypothetical protein QPK87_15450 [Kamptonema cortianum]|nr:hypothetical protein [Kamptonema cortianum]MDL5046084.1 hypothetical protein [Oscillatoria amoena NRMC-F 0135]